MDVTEETKTFFRFVSFSSLLVIDDGGRRRSSGTWLVGIWCWINCTTCPVIDRNVLAQKECCGQRDEGLCRAGASFFHRERKPDRKTRNFAYHYTIKRAPDDDGLCTSWRKKKEGVALGIISRPVFLTSSSSSFKLFIPAQEERFACRPRISPFRPAICDEDTVNTCTV